MYIQISLFMSLTLRVVGNVKVFVDNPFPYIVIYCIIKGYASVFIGCPVLFKGCGNAVSMVDLVHCTRSHAEFTVTPEKANRG